MQSCRIITLLFDWKNYYTSVRKKLEETSIEIISYDISIYLSLIIVLVFAPIIIPFSIYYLIFGDQNAVRM